jgi:N-glycosylase/DNA lyase
VYNYVVIVKEETCLFRIISSQNNNLIVEISDFNPFHTFLCGQCFRWNVNEDGIWTGVISDLGVRLFWDGKTCTFLNMSKSEFIDSCVYYFDLDTDYGKIKTSLAEKDENLKEAISHGHGIRLLRQDFWETLISFLISQNNNIPRIKRIIESLCSNFGLPLKGESTQKTFPTTSALANASLDDLNICRGGYRCRYVSKTAAILNQSPYMLGHIQKLPPAEIRKFLLSLPGIGEKVADCTLLYSGLDRSTFPIDRWVKRVMETLYFKQETDVNSIREFARDYFGDYAGIAQQYLFYYAISQRIGI